MTETRHRKHLVQTMICDLWSILTPGNVCAAFAKFIPCNFAAVIDDINLPHNVGHDHAVFGDWQLLATPCCLWEGPQRSQVGIVIG